MSTSGIFSRTGVRFEVAQDVLGAIIAHHSERIAVERDKDQPDEAAIELAQQAKEDLRDIRDNLDPKDDKAIEAIIKNYGEQARRLYA
jgi:hypothetical protein